MFKFGHLLERENKVTPVKKGHVLILGNFHHALAGVASVRDKFNRVEDSLKSLDTFVLNPINLADDVGNDKKSLTHTLMSIVLSGQLSQVVLLDDIDKEDLAYPLYFVSKELGITVSEYSSSDSYQIEWIH